MGQFADHMPHPHQFESTFFTSSRVFVVHYYPWIRRQLVTDHRSTKISNRSTHSNRILKFNISTMLSAANPRAEMSNSGHKLQPNRKPRAHTELWMSRTIELRAFIVASWLAPSQTLEPLIDTVKPILFIRFFSDLKFHLNGDRIPRWNAVTGSKLSSSRRNRQQVPP